MDKLDFTRLKENTTHGNFILPFSIYKGTISPTFPSIAVHWHEEIEVIIVIDGSCNYRIDLDSFIINKGDIALSGNLKEIKKDFGRNRVILSANNYTLEELKEICESKFSNLVIVYEVKKDFLVLELSKNSTKNELLKTIINSDIDIEKFSIYEPSLTDIFVLKAGDE